MGKSWFEVREGEEVLKGTDLGDLLEQVSEGREATIRVTWNRGEGEGWSKAKLAMTGVESGEAVRKLARLREEKSRECQIVTRGATREEVLKKLKGLVNKPGSWMNHLKKVSMWALFDYWTMARDQRKGRGDGRITER
jgi:hypothetical protein